MSFWNSSCRTVWHHVALNSVRPFLLLPPSTCRPPLQVVLWQGAALDKTSFRFTSQTKLKPLQFSGCQGGSWGAWPVLAAFHQGKHGFSSDWIEMERDGHYQIHFISGRWALTLSLKLRWALVSWHKYTVYKWSNDRVLSYFIIFYHILSYVFICIHMFFHCPLSIEVCSPRLGQTESCLSPGAGKGQAMESTTSCH